MTLGDLPSSWRLIPLSGNKPAIATGKLHLGAANSDPKQIETWWQRYGGLGLVTGAASGVVAIDVDVRDGRDGMGLLARLEAQYGPLPRNLTVTTKSGGLHIYCAHPGAEIKIKSVVGGSSAPWNEVGVDTRGDGGYVAMPPTKGYQFSADLRTTVLQPLPQGWINVLQDVWRESPGTVVDPVYSPTVDYEQVRQTLEDQRQYYLTKSDQSRADTINALLKGTCLAVPGNRDNTVNWVGYTFGIYCPGIGPQVASGFARPSLAAMTSTSDGEGLEHWIGKFEDAYERGASQKQTENRLELSMDFLKPAEARENFRRFANVIPELPTLLAASEEPKAETENDPFAQYVAEGLKIVKTLGVTNIQADKYKKPTLVNAAERVTQVIPKRPWLVDGLFTAGGVIGIVGEPKSSKSWLATEIGIAVASGTVALDRYKVPQAKKVYYFYTEDEETSVLGRLRAFAKGRGLPAEALLKNFFYDPKGKHLDLTKDEDLAYLYGAGKFIGGAGLIILDTLRNVHSGTENESDSMARVLQRLHALSKALDCTILIVHHAKKVDPKNVATNGSEFRGSSVINGALDGWLSLTNLGGDRETTLSCDMTSVVKAGRSGGTKRLTLKLRDFEGTGDVEIAKWEVLGKGEEIARDAFEINADQIALDAYTILERVCLAEARRASCSRSAILTGSKISAKGFFAAQTWAVKEGWIVVTSHGTFRSTDKGKEIYHKEHHAFG